MAGLIDRRIAIVLTGLLVFSVFCVLLSDWALTTTLDRIRIASLASHSRQDLVGVQAANEQLERRTDSLQTALAAIAQMKPPRLDDIHDMCRERGLVVRALERVTGQPETLRYKLVVDGRISSLVDLLLGLERGYVFDIDYVQLYPANPDGSRVALAIQLTVSES